MGSTILLSSSSPDPKRGTAGSFNLRGSSLLGKSEGPGADDDDGPEDDDDEAGASGMFEFISTPLTLSARIGTFSTTLSAYIFADSGQKKVIS